MTGPRLALALAAILLTPCAAAAASEPLVFGAANVGAPFSGAPAELYRPAGAGPFPAVVVLHGCDGVTQHYRVWAQRLASWGYIALLVDSFGPRGFGNNCGRGMAVPPLLRAADALAAARWLATQAEIRPGRIGVVGFSHGGWTVMKAVLEPVVDADGGTPFRAAVAFYPGCEPQPARLATDTLILIGDADDWTPARRCLALERALEKAGHVLEVVVYPGAVHAFDTTAPRHVYLGHAVGGDPAAAADAIARTRGFFDQRLAAPTP